MSCESTAFVALLQNDRKYTASSKLVFPTPLCPMKQFIFGENSNSACAMFL